VDDPVCGFGYELFTATSGLQVWNTTTQRQIYNLFNEKVNEEPDLAAGSVVLLESYSTQGVRAVNPDSTAYALRGDNLLTYVWPSFLTPQWLMTGFFEISFKNPKK
jgi:hypothetical protein